jgi:hypothetical protein
MLVLMLFYLVMVVVLLLVILFRVACLCDGATHVAPHASVDVRVLLVMLRFVMMLLPALKFEIVYNNTSINRLLSLGPPFCYAIQDLVD